MDEQVTISQLTLTYLYLKPYVILAAVGIYHLLKDGKNDKLRR